MIAVVFPLTWFLLPIAASGGEAPCVRPTRPGTQVQGEVRVCPGRYRIADRREQGIIIAAASGTRIDLAGVILESGDSIASRFVGAGVVSRGVDRVTITGGDIQGFRYGIRLEGGRGHRVTGTDLSGSRSHSVRSTPARPDSADQLDLLRPEIFEAYGGGILLKRTTGVSITGVISRGAQNGIALMEVRDGYIADNDLAMNNGWGVHLWRSSRNVIARNRANSTRRCESQLPAADCGAAAILLRDASDSNTIVDNDVTASSLGLLIAGEHRGTRPSVGNLVIRNDGSFALRTAFASFFGWSNTFLGNRADSVSIGFRLDHSGGSMLQGNTVIGARTAAVVSEHGSDNVILANVLMGGPIGIRVAAPARTGDLSRQYRIDDNVLSRLDQGIVIEHTTGARVRGNVFDGVGDGLVIDGAGHGSEVTGNVFLKASRWFIEAPDLAAGGNYWATADARAATAKVKGRISILPWNPASDAGY
ncbi:MAG TPA: NosD domain-containing protein [Gemmatimonadales bacterium]|nr:NosD domain-containing protein [Gemmatimonadales bacterium]